MSLCRLFPSRSEIGEWLLIRLFRLFWRRYSSEYNHGCENGSLTRGQAAIRFFACKAYSKR